MGQGIGNDVLEREVAEACHLIHLAGIRAVEHVGKSTAFGSGFLAGEEDATAVAVGAVAEGGGGGQVGRAEAVKRGGGAVGPGGAVSACQEEIVGRGEEVLAADHGKGGFVDGEIRHIGALGTMGTLITGRALEFMRDQDA